MVLYNRQSVVVQRVLGTEGIMSFGYIPEQEYWVEAREALRGSGRVISYGVWHINPLGARTCVRRFSIHRVGSWQTALHLANTLRDELNVAEATSRPGTRHSAVYHASARVLPGLAR